MKMKKIACLLALFQIFSITNSFALTVVTDIDDTIKMTNVGHPANAVFRALASKRSFAGMTEVYNALANRSTVFTYLSGSPNLLGSQIANFLQWNHFPEGDIVLRTLQELNRPTLEYKIAKLERFLSHSSDQFLLIGDDTESDFDAYDAIAKAHPERIVGIYIHQIRGIKLPKGQKPFLTSFDLALALYADKRVTIEDVNLAKTVLEIQRNPRNIIPNFQICPKDYVPTVEIGSASVESTALAVQNLIRKICSARSALTLN